MTRRESAGSLSMALPAVPSGTAGSGRRAVETSTGLLRVARVAARNGARRACETRTLSLSHPVWIVQDHTRRCVRLALRDLSRETARSRSERFR